MTANEERQRRWRLILGKGEEGSEGGGAGGQGSGAEPEVGPPLSSGDKALDEALDALYGEARGGDLSASMPDVARWLGDVRAYFPEPVVQMMQRDALARLTTRQLVEHPDLLAQVEPDAALAAQLLALRKVMPERTLETARQVVAQVVRDLVRRLDYPLRQAATGSLNLSLIHI